MWHFETCNVGLNFLRSVRPYVFEQKKSLINSDRVVV